MTLVERLVALAVRRDDEGIYTDAAIATFAADEIVKTRAFLKKLADVKNREGWQGELFAEAEALLKSLRK